MSETSALRITKLDTGQAQKEATINEAFDIFDATLAGTNNKNLGGASTAQTLTSTEARKAVHVFTSAGAAIDIKFPLANSAHRFTVKNSSGFTLTIKTDAGGSSGIAILNGETSDLFINGDDVEAPEASTSVGDLVLNVKSFGALGDGSTDDTLAIQAAVDFLDGLNRSGTIFFPDGVYKVSGALQDTGNSNAQILLPRRSSSETSMITVELAGATPAPTYAVKRNAGAVIESDLSSGTGSMIGGKVASGAWPVTGNSWCSVSIRNITFRLPADPSNSCLDLTYYPNVEIRNTQVSTDEDVISVASNPPTYGITEPTTSSSYGIKLAPVNIPDQVILENVQVYGYYTGIRSGELAHINNTVVIFCKQGVEIPTALHAQKFGRLYISDCGKGLVFTGGASYIDIAQLDLEHSSASPAWANMATDIDDPSNLGHGIVRWHISTNGAVGVDLTQNGAFYLWTEALGNTATTHHSSMQVQVMNSGNISIANNTLPGAGVGNVTFDTDMTDEWGMHSTSSNTDRLVPTKEGVVYVKFNAVFAQEGGGAANGQRQARLYKHTAAGGGAEILLDLQNFPAMANTDKSVSCAAISRTSNPGDYFYFVVYQNSGGALNLLTANFYSPLATMTITR